MYLVTSLRFLPRLVLEQNLWGLVTQVFYGLAVLPVTQLTVLK